MTTIVNKTQRLEKKYTKNFMLRTMMLSYYKPIVKRERKLINKEVKEVLCIGGGNFPATAILFAKQLNSNVTVIDNDPSTISTANEVIRIYKLEDKVKVVNTDGLNIDASSYDIIHIASQISPKADVISQVRATKEVNAKIIIRVPKKTLRKYYADFVEVDAIKIKQPWFSNIGYSYLYE